MHVIKGSQHLAAGLQQPEICKVVWYHAEPDHQHHMGSYSCGRSVEELLVQ